MAEERVQRRLAAILAADVVGYSRLMGENEVGTRQRFNAHLHELIEPAIASRQGRIVKTTGDALLVEFASVVDAIQCAVDIQKSMADRNAHEPDDRRMEFRIGVNLGDVIIEGEDIHGDGVNIAARLEGLADPGGVCISGTVFDQIGKKLELFFDDLGDQSVKNIEQPVRCYRVQLETGEGVDTPSLMLTDKPSIAVLPFANMSGDPEQEYFVDGIVEDIITALSRMRWFGVISRNSTFAYKGQSPDIRRVARELGVRYVLEGSIRKSANRVRITAQLIEGASDTHLWSQRYDRELGDLFDIQDEITDAVAGQIEPELRKAELDRNRRIRPSSMQTWDIYQRGMSLIWRRDHPDHTGALDYFRRASELDPNFSAAFSGISHACFFIVLFHQTDDEKTYIDEGFEAALRAVELDGEDAFARLSLGSMHRFKGNVDECIAEIETAIQLNPLSSLAYISLSRTFCDTGRFSESLEMAEKGISVSPNDPDVGIAMARAAEACLFLRDYDKSIEWMRKALRQPVVPRVWGRAALIAALGHAGDLAGAQLEIAELLSRAPEFSLSFARKNYPNQNPEYLEFYIDGLRKAGLPE
jgi:adenylate cyclase